jgi:hypothetical protein
MRRALRFTASFLAVIIFFLSTPRSNAQNDSFETAKQVLAGVYHVASGGFWTAGKDEGFFRAVVTAGGVEHVSHHLFIQWLRSDAKVQGYALVRTVNVKELNLGHGYLLEIRTSFGDMNAFEVNVTENSRDGKRWRFAITAKGDGKCVVRAR